MFQVAAPLHLEHYLQVYVQGAYPFVPVDTESFSHDFKVTVGSAIVRVVKMLSGPQSWLASLCIPQPCLE